MEAREKTGVTVSFDSVGILTVHLNTASNEMVAVFFVNVNTALERSRELLEDGAVSRRQQRK